MLLADVTPLLIEVDAWALGFAALVFAAVQTAGAGAISAVLTRRIDRLVSEFGEARKDHRELIDRLIDKALNHSKE